MIPWLLVSIIIGGILVYINNLKKFKTNFYTSLSKSQLQEELINILDLILHEHSITSNFANISLENYNELKSLIQYYTGGLRNGNIEVIQKLPFEFFPKGTFYELAKNNPWKNEFGKISTTFSIIYSEFREKMD